jgi:hypothetical protein
MMNVIFKGQGNAADFARAQAIGIAAALQAKERMRDRYGELEEDDGGAEWLTSSPERFTRSERREHIATHVLAAIVGSFKGELAPGMHGKVFAEVACEYADSLLNELRTYD